MPGLAVVDAVTCAYVPVAGIEHVPARYRARYRTRGRLGIGAEYARGVSLAVRRMRVQPPGCPMSWPSVSHL